MTLHTPTRRRLLAAGGAALAGTAAVVGSVASTGIDDGASDSGGRVPGTAPTDRVGSPESIGGWPMSRYDPGGTAYNPDASGPKDGVRPVWTHEIDRGHGFHSTPPVVGDGVVYATVGGRLSAVDAATGRRRFAVDRRVASAPAVAGAAAYRRPTVAATDGNGRLHGFDAGGGVVVADRRLGVRRWATPAPETETIAGVELGGGSPGTPVVAGGSVFVVADGLLAVDASSGRVRWRRPAYGSRPAVADGVVYAPVDFGTVAAYDAASGAERWRADVGQRRVESVAATPTRLYVVTSAAVVAVDVGDDGEGGTERWRAALDVAHDGGGLAVAEGSLLVPLDSSADGDAAGGLAALDAATGERRWTAQVRPEHGTGPSVADGVVYLPTEPTTVVAVDLDTGETRFEFATDGIHGSPVAAVDDRLYALDDGTLYALEER